MTSCLPPLPSCSPIIGYALLLSITLLTILVPGCLISGSTTPPSGLTTPEWHLLSYRGDDGSDIPAIGDVTLRFNPDGTFNGNSGCNQYSASYSVEGELLTIGPIASTERYCQAPEGVMAEEHEYLTRLSNTTRYHVSDNNLVLSYYDVEKLLVFVKR
jgi:heat shock protein HslJ